MNNLQLTQHGTVVGEGIEYNQVPSPSSLIKATEKKWGVLLRDEGCLRLHSLNYYQSLENPELGDTHEGKGMLKYNGHEMHVRSHNEVFIWCCAEPNASPEVLKSLDPSYDTIITVVNVEELVKRMIVAARSDGYKLTHPHIGKVIYNRGEEVSKDVLNNQQWHYNVFQKGMNYAHQREYRISFSNCSFQRTDKQYLDLMLGNCSDIVQIET